jgi:hypothetical protein
LKVFKTDVYWISTQDAESERFSWIDGIVFKVFNFDAAVEFWTKGLRFQVSEISETDKFQRWAVMNFPSLVKSWRLKVVIVEDESVRENRRRFLDDPGFTSICFLTTNIEQDRKAISQFPNAEFGEIFSLTVAGRSLNVCVGKGPNNELIELIKIENPNKL